MEVDVDELSRLWNQAWRGCPPLGHLLRGRFADRWVRFHSLAQSQRYPQTQDDYEKLLLRHNTILAELRAKDVYLISVRYPADDLAAGSEPMIVGLHPGAVRWMDVTDPDDLDATPVEVYVSRQGFVPGSLDGLLAYVADGRASEVIAADTGMRWLYHPYDGGADVIAPSTSERDRLRENHRDWLSSHPHGM